MSCFANRCPQLELLLDLTKPSETKNSDANKLLTEGRSDKLGQMGISC